MSRRWAEFLLFIVVVAQFFCLTACLTSGSRMLFAFSRDRAVPGHQLWRKVVTPSRSRWAVLAVVHPRLPAHGPDLVEQPRRLLRRHVGRHRRSLHRVHPAGDPPAAGRATSSSTAPGASGSTTSGSTRSRSSGSSFISIVFMLPTAPAGSRETTGSTGTSSTTRRSRSAAPSSCSAAGGCSRRRTGSSAPCGWAPTRSSSSSRPSRRPSSCCRPTRSTSRSAAVTTTARRRGAPQGAPRSVSASIPSRRRRSGRSPAP